MKKPKRRAFRLILLLLIILIGRSCLYSDLKDREFITDENGRAMILHGFNINGDAKSDPLFIGEADETDFRRMNTEWGMNKGRFLVFWGAIEPEKGKYDTAYIERVKKKLDEAERAGIYMILDMHQDLYTWKFGGDGAPEWAIEDDGEPFEMQSPWEKNYVQPATIAAINNFWMPEKGHKYLQEHYIKAFMFMVEQVKGHPALLGYELHNEPVMATWDFISFEDKYLHPFYQELTNSIRTIDNDAWIFYEPMALGPNQGFGSGLDPLEDPRDGEPKLAYYPHIYTLDLDILGKYLGIPVFTASWATNRRREAKRHNAPMLTGEFGLNTTTPGAHNYLERVMRLNEKISSGWAYWDYGKGHDWAPLHKDGSLKPMMYVLLRPYPQYTAGHPVKYGYKPRSGKFQLHYLPDPQAVDSTVIFIPEHCYPDGWKFGRHKPEDGSWRWDKESRKLFIAAPADQKLQKISIKKTAES